MRVRLRWCHGASYAHQVMTHLNSNMHQYIPTYFLFVQSQHDIYTQYMYSVNINIRAQPCVMCHRRFSVLQEQASAHQCKAVCHCQCYDTVQVCNCDTMVSSCDVYQTMTLSNPNMHQYQRTICSFKVNTIPLHIYAMHLFNQHQDQREA